MEIEITVEAAVHLDQPGLLLLRCSRRPHLRPVPNNMQDSETLKQLNIYATFKTLNIKH